MIELHETNGTQYIKLLYLNDTESQQPIPLNLHNCTDTNNECVFSKFVESVADLIPNDWDLECHNREESSQSNIGLKNEFFSIGFN